MQCVFEISVKFFRFQSKFTV